MAKRTERETQTVKSSEVGSLEDVLTEKPAKALTEEAEAVVEIPDTIPTPAAVIAPIADPVPEPNPEPQPTAQATGRLGIACPSCGSSACGIAGGMRHCNQCGHSWA